jgi:hypothetical protein
MTPCEELGYKVGDKFRVIGNPRGNFAIGSIIELARDDGSTMPPFRGLWDGRRRTLYMPLHEVSPVEPVSCEEDGMKVDSEKAMLGLIDPGWMESVAEVMTFGAKKYAPDNWKKLDKERYLNAAYRHLLAYHKGEINDPESGLPHLSHLSCCIMFLHYFENQQKQP